MLDTLNTDTAAELCQSIPDAHTYPSLTMIPLHSVYCHNSRNHVLLPPFCCTLTPTVCITIFRPFACCARIERCAAGTRDLPSSCRSPVNLRCNCCCETKRLPHLHTGTARAIKRHTERHIERGEECTPRGEECTYREARNAHTARDALWLCCSRVRWLRIGARRWGVTAEESAKGDVIKLCLEEIDACNPWFIGMLGNR